MSAEGWSVCSVCLCVQHHATQTSKKLLLFLVLEHKLLLSNIRNNNFPKLHYHLKYFLFKDTKIVILKLVDVFVTGRNVVFAWRVWACGRYFKCWSRIRTYYQHGPTRPIELGPFMCHSCDHTGNNICRWW